MDYNDPKETPPVEGKAVVSTTDADDASMDDEWWIELTREMHGSSHDYMEANYYAQWEKNLDNFNSRHPSGSKYYSDLYKSRANLFRPRTRAAVRNGEATCAAAFFSNADQVNVEAVNPNNPVSMASAALMKELIEYRLDNTIPWFQIVVGGYQDTTKHGICVAAVEWDYDEEEDEEVRVDLEGNELMNGLGEPIVDPTSMVLTDKPVIRLVAPENCGFAPSASWIDPAADSPYFYESCPMFLEDVLVMMEKGHINKAQVPFRDVSKDEILATDRSTESESVEHARHQDRQDPTSDHHETIEEFRTIWVYKNIARVGGIDWFWLTAGESVLLSDPVPLIDVYPHLNNGERPYVVGVTNIESHVAIPSGMIEISEDLQATANTIQNDRADNVRLAMNKRYFARRSANVDYRALVRGAPGVVVNVDDPERDIKVEENQDVTSSAYQEQDRINQDFDEIWGNFSVPSVASSRNLNETVGGMNLMTSAAEKIAEYSVKIYAETFINKVLRQLGRMEAFYETDTVVLGLAANRADLAGFGIQQIDDKLMMQDLLIKINVGVGATDPMRRINSMNIAMDTLGKASQIPFFRIDEIGREVFGALGYKDGARFIDPEIQPVIEELQAQIQELQFDKQAKMAAAQGDIERERVRQQGFIDAAKMEAQGELSSMQLKTYIDMIDLYLKAEQNDIKRLDLQQQAEKAVLELQKMALDSALTEGRDSRQNDRQKGLVSHTQGVQAYHARQANEQQGAGTENKQEGGGIPRPKEQTP